MHANLPKRTLYISSITLAATISLFGASNKVYAVENYIWPAANGQGSSEVSSDAPLQRGTWQQANNGCAQRGFRLPNLYDVAQMQQMNHPIWTEEAADGTVTPYWASDPGYGPGVYRVFSPVDFSNYLLESGKIVFYFCISDF